MGEPKEKAPEERAPAEQAAKPPGFPPPRQEDVDRAIRLLEPLTRVTSPVFYGMESIPEERPLLFVGNHTLMGVMDAPFMFMELYRRKGIFLRALGDHAHFKVPVWRDLVQRYGVVDGTRENCARLFQTGECVLVFPGGAREVTKRKGEKHKLVWQKRLGFVRMALTHGCTIVPFAALGIEDAYDIVLDPNELMKTRVGRFLGKLGLRDDLMPPLVFGVGLLPRPERLYFKFLPAIRTEDLRGMQDDDATCWALRDQVAASIEEGLLDLRHRRARDPHRKLVARLRDGVTGTTVRSEDE